MEDLMKLLIFLCLLFWPTVFALPHPQHSPTGAEHIVIINKQHPTPPRISDVLSRLQLDDNHPSIKHIYNNSAFHGFAAAMDTHCLSLLAQMDDLSLVEPSTNITTTSISTPDTKARPHHLPDAFNIRNSAPWGLQRISTSSTVDGNPGHLTYTYSFHSPSLGSKADIYIIDTGIYTQNQIFQNRAKMLWSFDGNLTAIDGHGTHVSGIAAGAVLGVASNAHLLGLKALSGSGSGSTSDVIKAIDLAIARHDRRKAHDPKYTGAVISMSLASPSVVPALNHAVDAATAAGIHAVIAAGNNGGKPNACDISPASAGGAGNTAISVGAIDIHSRRARFSNFGPCVDLYAPGVDVISSWIGAPDRVASLSGTSMATPHVTGLVAYAMTNETLARDPALMKEFILRSAVRLRSGILVANNGVKGGRH